MTNLAIERAAQAYGDKVVLDGVDLTVPEGTILEVQPRPEVTAMTARAAAGKAVTASR